MLSQLVSYIRDPTDYSAAEINGRIEDLAVLSNDLVLLANDAGGLTASLIVCDKTHLAVTQSISLSVPSLRVRAADTCREGINVAVLLNTGTDNSRIQIATISGASCEGLNQHDRVITDFARDIRQPFVAWVEARERLTLVVVDLGTGSTITELEFPAGIESVSRPFGMDDSIACFATDRCRDAWFLQMDYIRVEAWTSVMRVGELSGDVAEAYPVRGRTGLFACRMEGDNDEFALLIDAQENGQILEITRTTSPDDFLLVETLPDQSICYLTGGQASHARLATWKNGRALSQVVIGGGEPSELCVMGRNIVAACSSSTHMLIFDGDLSPLEEFVVGTSPRAIASGDVIYAWGAKHSFPSSS